MTKNQIVFVAHQDHENLGVEYLTSMLIDRGFEIEILDFGLENEEILNMVAKADLLLIGFSLLFQAYTSRLQDLASYLRSNGVASHFTVGGHYSSLRSADILKLVPELDSVVRFEGEITICELAESLRNGKDWRGIEGIAYVGNKGPISNRLRPLIQDLDSLPFPTRVDHTRFQCMDINFASILASRGCIRNCSFCSIRRFYQTPPGKLRRSRSPENVVAEMKGLYENYETKIFLFQDDDFLLPGKVGSEWISDFICRLEREEFVQDILWKISCRSDEVDFDLFKTMKAIGLEIVGIGIESGNPTGLKILNKQLSVEDNIAAVKILKRLNLLFEFGFMLFDPSSTFDSVLANIRFLETICGDGFSPVVYCKMLPYAETDIEKRLLKEGRLRGTLTQPDYDFLDPNLNNYYWFMYDTFRDWMGLPTGLLARLRWHRFEVSVLKKFYPYAIGIPKYEASLTKIIKSSNELFFHIAKNALEHFRNPTSVSEYQLKELANLKTSRLKEITTHLSEGMALFQKWQKSSGD